MNIHPPDKSTWLRRAGLWLVASLLFLLGLTVGNPNWVGDARANLPSAAIVQGWVQPPADLPLLTIDMPFANYNLLLEKRTAAFATGAVLATPTDFVNADIRLTQNGQTSTIPVRLRLRQGPADWLAKGGKWAFDGQTRQGTALLGLQQFSLQDPATNGWLNQWLFTESLAEAGILTARQQFVQVVFNGEAKGIYALQTQWGMAALAAQGREPGAVVGFDTARLWLARGQFDGDWAAALADPVARVSLDDYRLLEVATERDPALVQDEILTAQFEGAVGRLRQMQQGEIAPSAVFKAAQYGAFLAQVDLWGAMEAVSLLNVQFYANPATDRLEPIAGNGNPLADPEARIEPIHFFADPQIAAAYVQTAVSLTDPAYVDQLEATYGVAWAQLNKAVAAEVTLESPWAALRQRQELLRHTLEPVEPVLAYLGPPSATAEGVVEIELANRLTLPLELVGFQFGDSLFLPMEGAWVQDGEGVGENGRFPLRATPPDSFPRYLRVRIPLTALQNANPPLDDLRSFDLFVVTRLVGLENGRLLSRARSSPNQ
ncbi:MAG: hypothetical protein KDE56_14635 [Anaerolineales bacterium]|nr:hypothetical protein [Anaerolineales bacterium]